MSSDLLITLIFAAIAAFVIFKLRSVLGTRTGHEKQPEPAPQGEAKTDNVAGLPNRRAEPRAEEPWGAAPAWLAAARAVDPKFDPAHFLSGAKAAFEMIVESFAKGDEKTLKPLLAPDVFQSFADAIKTARDAGETRETTLVGFKSAEIADARAEGSVLAVTVAFVSEQTNVTRDRAGTVIDGDPKAVETVSDRWTFQRDHRSRDPNWQLVETNAD
jgi:predicted lipid-binding transport protein (Tim44 family)